MKKILLTFTNVLALFVTANAQDEFDALRYGYTNYYGTARGLSVGNAMGSVGGDFSALSINPAGIGIYRRGEFVLSPSFQISNNTGTYQNNTNLANSSKLNMSQFGIVLTNAKKGNLYKRSAWKAGSFAIGANRLATFNNEYTYSGNNFQSSLIEKYADEFNSLGGIKAINSVSYPAYAAYETWLIDRGFGADSNTAVSYVPFTGGINQNKHVYERGGINELVISGGGNYKEVLLLGATVGITSLNYKRTLNYNEEDISGDNNNDFKYMHFTENLSTNGTGINLKLGAIIKPSDNFRFGLALHTPTYYQLNDLSQIGMESHTDSLLLHSNPNNSPISSYSQDTALSFNYGYSSPYKAILSGTAFMNQYGFISADIELVGYSSMKYYYEPGFENIANAMNTVIKNLFKTALNARIGAEVKLENFMLRAGAAYYGSPYKNTQYDASKLNLSFGLGYRADNWFTDITYINSNQKYGQQPYTLSNTSVPFAEIKNSTSNVVFTVGIKF
ncbi:MAG TPA: hypothetical protein PKA54_00020 [Chitinophagaceae bacterium]|nr:MAG: aromatic hydrocarbon degradation membrane protein [Bacteroidetes bacterium OLB11]HMN31736.1 hypothetical protein [Chitinophagaceae bacterium]